MNSKRDFLLNKTLGKDFFESLEKFELWKPKTKTVTDHEELRSALAIVPKVIISFLTKELAPMALEETKEIELPLPSRPILKATKKENDCYTGEILDHNKMIAEFKYRPIPGIGLIILSTYELYNEKEAQEKSQDKDLDEKIQKIIDERLALNSLVEKVVEKQIREKEAVNKLLLSKLTQSLENPKKSIGSEKLNKFIENRKNKEKNREFVVQMTKAEHINCPDCRKEIFDGTVFSGCLCLGSDMDKKVFFKKTEEGFKIKFPKSFDVENIEMLLDVLRRKRG